MNAGQRIARRAASRLGRPVIDSSSICPSCRSTILTSTPFRRPYASTAAAAVASTTSPIIGYAPPTATSTTPQQYYEVRAGVVLSRPPQITRDLTSFEKAFYLYQRRLNERLALPFTRYFYFPKDTPADVEWKRKIKERQTPARDIGAYAAYSKEGWNDEVVIGAPESETEWQVQKLLDDAEPPAVVEGEEQRGPQVKHEPVERPAPRVTEADVKNDTKSLNRLLQKSLYLLVKNEDGRWIFPEAPLERKEVLHVAAERVLVQSCGINMNTWVVGNTPIGHYSFSVPPSQVKPNAEATSQQLLGERTFFMKARIMAGQADLQGNQLGVKDFQWLAKDEVQKVVTPKYWKAIQNMFAER